MHKAAHKSHPHPDVGGWVCLFYNHSHHFLLQQLKRPRVNLHWNSSSVISSRRSRPCSHLPWYFLNCPTSACSEHRSPDTSSAAVRDVQDAKDHGEGLNRTQAPGGANKCKLTTMLDCDTSEDRRKRQRHQRVLMTK